MIGARRTSTHLVMLLAALCLFSSIQISANAQEKSTERLKFVLVLTRHGVRSPTWTNARLDGYSAGPWPVWPVAPGLLTPHGKKLMTEFGSYYRSSFTASGLLSASGCEDAGKIFIYADTDQRTIETGHGLADGMMPGCSVEVHSQEHGKQDALFHPVGAVGKPDPQLAYAALAGRMGSDPKALSPAYQSELKSMQSLLNGCPTSPCKSSEKKLLNVATALAPGSDDHLAELKGPFSTASTFAENLQLEYLEGMTTANVGWGQADEAKIRELMAIHAAASDLVQRTPYIASVQASNLLWHILQTLNQAHQGKTVKDAIGSSQAKAVVLVGHDTNIANLAALLNLHWLINGYQRDDAAPGGALLFELWQRDDGNQSVRVSYQVQTPDQMRDDRKLSAAAPPAKATTFIPGCSTSDPYASCTWERFAATTEAVIDHQFVP